MISKPRSKGKIDNFNLPSPPTKPDDISKVNDNNNNGDVRFPSSEVVEEDQNELVDDADEGDGEHCVICLHEIRDRTILPCAHDRLCFECIFVWCQQSRKCPLCNAPIGAYLIHNFRSDYDYSKYYLPPLRSPPPLLPPPPSNNHPLIRPSETRVVQRSHEVVQWGRRRNTLQERADELELAISKRRWIYRHGLYALHVASNSHTRYRSAPTPVQFAASQDTITRATVFIRRELRVWINLDVEFLTTFILSLMKSIDIRSESAIKLLAEFLDMEIPYHMGNIDEPSRGRFPNAEHFAHELYSYLRSPFKDLAAYDRAVVYEIPSHIPPPPDKPLPSRHEKRWEASPSRAAESSRHARRGREIFTSPSPLLRSPREAYCPSASPSSSSSPSPSDAEHDLHQYQYRPVSRLSPHRRRPSPSNRKRRRDDSPIQEDNRDDKGKGVRPGRRIRSKYDTWGSNRVEKPSRTSHNRASTAKHQRSVSPEEHYTRTRRKHKAEPSSTREAEDRNTNHHEDLSDSSSGIIGIISPDPPPKSTEVSQAKDGQTSTSTLDRPSSRDEAAAVLLDDAAPTDHLPDAPISPNWGISIKGQAKLLGENALKDDGTTSSQRGQRKTSELLHAHLQGPSLTANRGTNRSLDASSATLLKTGHNTEPPTNKNASISSQNGRDATTADRETTTPQNRLSLIIPSSSDKIVSSGRSMSAREIMARTRARLAKMRSDPSSECGPPTIHHPSSSVDTRPNTRAVNLSTTVRNYLLGQLEEEKRNTLGTDLRIRGSATSSQQKTGDGVVLHDDTRYPEQNNERETPGLLDTEQAVGQKRDPLSFREESLRSRLLSRKANSGGEKDDK